MRCSPVYGTQSLQKMDTAILTIKLAWAILKWWFNTYVKRPILAIFDDIIDGIKEKWNNMWTAIELFTKGGINSIIDALNAFIRGAVRVLNNFIDAMNDVGSVFPGFSGINNLPTPQIPRLASGAVIPPNKQFLAVLGDQTSGKNIEAPEGLIRKIIQEEMGSQETNVTITFEGSLAALVRELKPHIDQETTRVGTSLITGVTA